MTTTTDRATITELADELGHENGKRIRAYLRSAMTRSTDAKGSRWGDAKTGYSLTKTATAAVRERFTAKPEADVA